MTMEDQVLIQLGTVIGKLESVEKNQAVIHSTVKHLSDRVNDIDVTAATERATTKAHRGFVAGCAALGITIALKLWDLVPHAG